MKIKIVVLTVLFLCLLSLTYTICPSFLRWLPYNAKASADQLSAVVSAKQSNAIKSSNAEKEIKYIGDTIIQKYFDTLDKYIKKKQFAKAEAQLELIRNTKNAEECMPQAVCHAIREYEDAIVNESKTVDKFPKFTGIYASVGGGGAYNYFCVKKGAAKKCFTAYSGCKYVGDPQDGSKVTVFYHAIDDERAVKVIVHRKTRK